MANEVSQLSNLRCVAVIVAGGQGSRFGSDIPKQLVSLAGYPILHHTLRRFEQTSAVGHVVVVANQDWNTEIAEIANYTLRETPHQVVDGGVTRNESVGRAVQILDGLPDSTAILIHDGVRPFASEDTILRVLKALEEFDAVIPVIPSVDPLVRIQGRGVTNFEERSEVMRGQSPQGFLLRDLRHGFTSSEHADNFDTIFELLVAADPDLRIGYVDGDLNNIKITSPIDRTIAGQIMMDGSY